MNYFIRFILLTWLISGTAAAQYIVDNQRVADTYFQNGDYYAASQYYLKALDLLPPDAEARLPYGKEPSKAERRKKSDYHHVAFRLAESFRLYKDYLNAEKWYGVSLSLDDPQYASARFWHPVCLRANGKFTEAISGFERYLAGAGPNDPFTGRATLELASCRFAINQMKYPQLVRVSKLPGALNSAGSNYAPVAVNNMLYFTSSRPVTVSGKKEYLAEGDGAQPRIAKKATPYLNAIYRLEGSDGQAERIELLNDMEQATASFTPDRNTLFFTAWNNKTDKRETAVYRSVKSAGGTWQQPVKLGKEVNVSGFSSRQPHVTPDGKLLLFASDRPGGMGKNDLWFCTLENGAAGQAVNMGPMVNTAEDDEAPTFIPATGKLLFSSNGRVGLGGFDFYETEGSFGTNSWKQPENKGYPFNSPKDDLYFTAINGTADGYISSDRESVCCLELFQIRQEGLTIAGQLTDCVTGKFLAGASIRLVDSLDKTELAKTVTAESGRYSFMVTTRRPFILVLAKAGYFAKTYSYDFARPGNRDTLLNPQLCLESYRVNQPIVLKDVYYDFNMATLTASSRSVMNKLTKIMNDNPDIRVELGAHTDSKGTAEYNLDLSLRRAEACVSYLVEQGIDPLRLTSRGYGESMPVAPNTLANGKDNPEGRQMNRRTEFKVITDAVSAKRE